MDRQRVVDSIQRQRHLLDARLQRRIDSIDGQLHVIYSRRDAQATSRNTQRPSRRSEYVVDPLQFHALNLHGRESEIPEDVSELARDFPTFPDRFHSLVRQGSVLSELFHRLRCALRQVRHIVTDLRNRFLPWRISARMARRLELASLVRRLFVALDMNVLSALFLEFSRGLQDSLRRREFSPRQNEFLAQLNSEAIDKARVCNCHSGRGPQEYLRRAEEVLYATGHRGHPENPVGDNLQEGGTNCGGNPQQVGNSGGIPQQVGNSGGNASQQQSVNSSCEVNNIPEDLQPQPQRNQSRSQTDGYSSLADVLNQMLQSERPVSPLLVELGTIRHLLSVTLTRIGEERTNESPMEREEENYFLSQDTWAGLTRVVQMVLDMCGGEDETSARDSTDTGRLELRNLARTNGSSTASNETVNSYQGLIASNETVVHHSNEALMGESTLAPQGRNGALNGIPNPGEGTEGSCASANDSLNVCTIEGSFPGCVVDTRHSRQSAPFATFENNSPLVSFENHSANRNAYPVTPSLPDPRPRHLYANCSSNCTCPTCSYVEESAANLCYQPYGDGNRSFRSGLDPGFVHVDPYGVNPTFGNGSPSYDNVGPSYGGPAYDRNVDVHLEPQYESSVDPSYLPLEPQRVNSEAQFFENSMTNSTMTPSNGTIVSPVYGSASECSTTDATHSAYGANFSVNADYTPSETTWSNDCDSDRTSTAVTNGEWEDYETEMYGRYHVCNNAAGHNGIRCWLYGCYDGMNRQVSGDACEENVAGGSDEGGARSNALHEQNNVDFNSGTSWCNGDNALLCSNQDGAVTNMMNQMDLGATANPFFEDTSQTNRSLSSSQDIDERSDLLVSYSNLGTVTPCMNDCVENQEDEMCVGRTASLMQISDVVHQRIDEPIEQPNLGIGLHENRDECIGDQDVTDELSNVKSNACLALDTNNSSNDSLAIPLDHRYTTVAFEPVVRKTEMDRKNSQDTSQIHYETGVRDDKVDSRRRKNSSSRSDRQHSSTTDQSLPKRSSWSEETFEQSQNNCRQNPDSSSQSTSNSSMSRSHFTGTELKSSQNDRTAYTHHSFKETNDHCIPNQEIRPISTTESVQDVSNNVGTVDRRYSNAVLQDGSSVFGDARPQETDHGCNSNQTSASDRPYSNPSLHASTLQQSLDASTLQYFSASDILREFGFDILNRTKLSYNAKVFVPRAKCDEVVETSSISENSNGNSRRELTNAMDTSQSESSSYQAQGDCDSTNTNPSEGSTSTSRIQRPRNNCLSQRKNDGSSMHERKFDRREQTVSSNQFDNPSNIDNQLGSSTMNGTQSDTNHLMTDRSQIERRSTDRSSSESQPDSESLTVNDHNYAVSAKHHPLTRQDTEHSYACKKLKSSRKHSSKAENYRDTQLRNNPSGELMNYNEGSRNSSSGKAGNYDSKPNSDSSGANVNYRNDRTSQNKSDSHKETKDCSLAHSKAEELKNERCAPTRKNSKSKTPQRETASEHCAVTASPRNKTSQRESSTEEKRVSQSKSKSCVVNTEHAYSKHSMAALFDHEYAKASWSETALVDRMNHLTLQESEDEDDEDL